MAITVKVEGLKELEQSLTELTRATARNTLRRTLLKAGEPIAKTASELAPYDNSNPGRHLADTITVTTKAPPNADVGRAAFASAMRAGATRGEAGQASRAARAANPDTFARVWVGPNRHPKAITQEFGTYFHGPQPYMRPAWDAEQGAALDIIRRDLKAEIDKAVARARRRAAKQLAKAKGNG